MIFLFQRWDMLKNSMYFSCCEIYQDGHWPLKNHQVKLWTPVAIYLQIVTWIMVSVRNGLTKRGGIYTRETHDTRWPMKSLEIILSPTTESHFRVLIKFHREQNARSTNMYYWIYTSWIFNMKPKKVWKLIFIFNWVDFRFHVTLPETNIAPENRPSQKDPKGNDRIPTIHFQVQTLSFREGI